MSASNIVVSLRFFWRLEIAFFLCLILSIKTPGQTTVAISGNIQDPSGAPITANGTFVRFSLRNFGGQIPTAPSNPTSIGWPDKDFTPDNNGNVSGNIIPNQNITSPAGTFYHVCIWFRNQLFRCNDYLINAAFNLNSATPLSVIPNAGPGQIATQSFLCAVSVAATTWTCTHNFNDSNIVFDVYDTSGKRIFPDLGVVTNPNVLTLSWVVAQAGNAVIMHGSAINIATNQPNAIVSNPTGAQAINAGFALNIPASIFNLTSGAFNATFAHANTVNRTYTLPDASGTIAILNLVQTWPLAQTFSSSAVFSAGFTTGNSTNVSFGSNNVITTGANTAFTIGAGQNSAGELNFTGNTTYFGGAINIGTLSYNTTSQTLGASYNNDTVIPMTRTVGSGTAAMTTASIGSLACGATVTVSAAGVLTTDAISWSFNAIPAANPGELVVSSWPTANNVNFQYCNPTAGSVTPNAATLNWRVPR